MVKKLLSLAAISLAVVPHSTGDLSIQTIIQVNPPAELGLN